MELGLPKVISVEADWDALTDLPARATKYCPYLLVLVNEADARTAVVEKECGSWWHRDCAEAKAERILQRIAFLTVSQQTLYVAFEDYNSSLLDRVRQRRREHGGDGVSIRREDRLHLYSTQPLPGRMSPTYWISADRGAALELLAYQSLRLPSLGALTQHGPFGWSRGWQRNAQGKDGERLPYGWKSAGSTSYQSLQLALARTARKARLHFGVKFTPAVIPNFWHWKPPPEVPVEWWRQTLGEELNKDDE